MNHYSESQQIHLLPAASMPSASDAGAQPTAREESLPVPMGFSYLAMRRGLPPFIATTLPEVLSQWSMIEPLYTPRNQPRLLLISPPEIKTRLNGQIVPRIVVLKEKDQFQFDDDWILHVTIFNRPRVDKPPPQRVGQPCGVCRVALESHSKTVSCQCGQIFHCEDSGGLECARLLRECSSCGRPVILEEGFTYLPA